MTEQLTNTSAGGSADFENGGEMMLHAQHTFSAGTDCRDLAGGAAEQRPLALGSAQPPGSAPIPGIITAKQIRNFWSKVPVGEADACWLWKGCKHRNGYGGFQTGSLSDANRTMTSAHRVAWMITNGPILNGLFVCHRCDVRDCVNPAHLFLGTNSDNIRDAIRKGRAAAKPPARTKLTADAVIAIKRQITKGVRPSALARSHGVGFSTIAKIRDGLTWRGVQ